MNNKTNGSDQDSDAIYTTNQRDIVNHAKYCYENYPTIVNNIPKSKTVYSNSLKDIAKMDNMLSASQTDIGESSNLAQVIQSYSYCMDDERLQGYVCILSVLAQVAIDSAKRVFDVDVTQQIREIKKAVNIKQNKYPAFWLAIKKDFNKDNINYDLHCPMNYLYNLKFETKRPSTSTLPMSYFFNKHKLDINRRTCKRVEELIRKYSLELVEFNISDQNDSTEEYFLLRSDFDDLVNEIGSINISGNYLGLFSWLIDRAFKITPQHNNTIKTTLNKNKSLLLKTLYSVNSKNLLNCFKSCT